MKNILLCCLMVILFSGVMLSQLPPLIDREVFFGDPEISGVKISPDGLYITFIKPFKNVRNIWIKEKSEPFENARPLTADTTRPIPGYFWSRDSKYVLYVQDKGGDENYRVYAIDPKVAGDPVPPARDLTPQEKVRAMIIDVPKKNPDEIIIGLNDRNPQLHDVYRISLSTGERTLIRRNDDNIAGWLTDLDGNLRLGIRQTMDGGTEILKLGDSTLTPVYSVNAEESADPIRFTPDGSSFYLETNKGKIDKTQLELFDLKSGKAKLVEKDPKNEVDFGNVIFSDITDEILVTVYIGDTMRIYPKQKAFGRDYEILRKQIPSGNISLQSATADEKIWIISINRDVDPGSAYIFDRSTGEAKFLFSYRPNLPTQDLAPMKALRYKARDGVSIPAYLVLPKGIPSKKLPAIIFPHGGPWSRDTWGYNSIAQFLANRGYAVMLPNFRGSTGYGKKFLNAGNKQWGTGSMQHDLTDGVKYLIKKGIADPKKIGIAGGSYGGYATLAGLAFTPDLYAAGFDIVGPSNIITLLNSIPPYWAPMRKIFAVRVGDMDKPAERKMLEKQSPLNSAKNIKAPLFVVQGANDPRVKKAESDRIVAALRDLGRDVEYIVAPDEGHGFAGKENRIAMFTAMEKFFAAHLNGRVQTEVREDIKNKLDAITVDIKTVEAPEPAGQSGSTVMPGFDGSSVKPGTVKYSMNMDMQGQQMSMNLTRRIEKARIGNSEILRVVEETSGGMGNGVDTLELDSSTLYPLRRTAIMGPAQINITYAGKMISGRMGMGGQEMPIQRETEHILLSDGAGVELPLTTLPLVEGYTAYIYQFDIMTQSEKKMKLTVPISENVVTAAGTFGAFKVVLAPAEGNSGGSTIWIDKDTKRVVKSERKMPDEFGGGTIVMQMTE